MQSRDHLTDDISSAYNGRDIASDAPEPASAWLRVAAVAAAWLIPGAGHLILGRFGRGALFFFVIIGSFVTGLALQGRLYWPAPADTPSFLYFDLITVLWSFAQIGAGLCYIGSYLLGFGTTPHPEAATYEYGNTFMFLAGLLNYLIVIDAFDIAAGRKR